MQMGQFIDHDITHAPQFQILNSCGKNTLDCCGKDRTDRIKCYHLNIPRNDPKWAGIGDCMSFARSLRSADLKCSLDTNIQQVSEMWFTNIHTSMYIFMKVKPNRIFF